MARDAFSDAFAVEWADLQQDSAEQRYGMIAMVENRLLFVAYTFRAERRVIAHDPEGVLRALSPKKPRIRTA